MTSWAGPRLIGSFHGVAAGVVFLLACARPGDNGAGEAGVSDAKRVIADLEARVEDAHRTGDASFLDGVYAPTFRFVHSTGEVEPRAERLSALSAAGPAVLRRSLDSLDIDVHDDVALTTGRIHVIVEDEDPEWREYTVRYARVYALRSGRWQLLTHHSTGLTFGPPQ